MDRPKDHGPCDVCGVPVPWGYTCCRVAEPCSLNVIDVARLTSGNVRIRAFTGDDNEEGYAQVVVFDLKPSDVDKLAEEARKGGG